MPSFKQGRTAEDIHFKLSEIFRTLKDPRIDKLLTIVRIDLSGDMSHCKVYVSSMDGIEKAKTSVKGLQSAEGFIKRELFANLGLKKCPQLHFIADDSIEMGDKMLETIKKLNR